MRILLAWELGGNYGHLAKLLCIARSLRERRHRVQFVVKNDLHSRGLLDDEGFRYIFAPRSTLRKNAHSQPVSFADILSAAGFGSFKLLDGLVDSWQEIFNKVQPDVVVSQYAPVAQFAARLAKLPCLTVGTGFECPPDTAPFPCMRGHLRPTRAQLLARESNILQSVNRVLSRQGHRSFSCLQEVLKSDLKLLATLPELDHYPRRRNGRYIGPISILDYGMTIRWNEPKVPRIFVYLKPFPDIEKLLDVLAASGADVIAHVPTLDAKILTTYSRSSVRFTTSMVRLSCLQKDMDLAITHAGHGTACASLLAGVPLMMIPTTIEQWLTSRNVERLGCGIGMGRESGAKAYTAALDRFWADGSSYRQRAQKVAEKYARYSQKRLITRIANTIEGLPVWVAERGRPACSIALQ